MAQGLGNVSGYLTARLIGAVEAGAHGFRRRG